MHPKLHGSLAVVALMGGLLTGCSPNETADETADARSTTSSLASPTRPTTPPDVAELPAATIAQRAEAALRGGTQPADPRQRCRRQGDHRTRRGRS
jgi:hypothetical protein